MNEWEFHLLEDQTPLADATVNGVQLRVGDRVRLRPKIGGDILDLALTGKTATIQNIEQDYESRVHLAVVVDDDPGKELGLMKQPGHRFFFGLDEVELMP